MKLTEIASGLHHREHRVTVVAPHGSPLAGDCKRRAIPHVPLTPLTRYLDVVTATRLSRLLRERNTQLVVAGLSRDISTCILGCKFAGRLEQPVKLAFIQQMQFNSPRKDPFHRWAYGYVDCWITLTHRMREAALRNTTVAPERIAVNPFGSDLSTFDPSLYDADTCRREFGIPLHRPVVCVIGRLDPQKGQDYLIRALAKLSNTSASSAGKAVLVVAGGETRDEPGFGKTLRQLTGTLGLTDRVIFLNHTDNVARLLAAVDVFVLPSFGETFGFVLVEAMAMQKPVIATDAGGVPEIIEHGVSGLLVRPMDVDDLAAKIHVLLNDPVLAARLAQEAGRVSHTRFDFGRNLDELERRFSAILQQS